MQKPDTARIHQRFSRGLATYQDAAVVQKRMAVSLNELLKQTTAKRDFGTVLELGCGTGLLTDAFASCFTWEKLYLYDLIDACQNYHAHRQNACFQVADINTFVDYPQADLILAGATFQWVHDIDALLHRLGHALKPGGVLAFTTFAPGNIKEVHTIQEAGLAYLPSAALAEKLSVAGFEILHLVSTQEVLSFSTPRDVLEHLKATGVTASAKHSVWTKATLRSFEEDYEAFRTPDKRYPLTYTPVYCIARPRDGSRA